MTGRSLNNYQLARIEPKRLLIIKPSALGDICHALPVLHFLKKRFPESKIDWVCNKSFAAILKNNPYIYNVIEYNRHASLPKDLIVSWLSLIKILRGSRYDLVLDMQGLLRSSVMGFITGCNVRVGPSDAREGSIALYTHLTEKARPGTHAVMRNWSFARLFGADGQPEMGLIKPTSDSLDSIKNIISGYPRPFWILAPGARWMTKRWPVGHFAEIGKRLVENHGGSVFIVGAPDESHLTSDLASKMNILCLDLGGKTSLENLTALLSMADLVVANDSGPLHLACALGRPVASPFLCTRVELTGPFRQFVRAVTAPISCAGSLLRKCPTKQECMSALTPDLMWRAINNSLAGKPPWQIEAG